jgi:CheY-like chemotaxis protein
MNEGRIPARAEPMPATILLIDDDRMTVEITAARLRAAGYEVAEAYDAVHSRPGGLRQY